MTKMKIKLISVPGKGRGLQAVQPIKAGELIERAPVFEIGAEDYKKTKEMPYINHTFVWRNDRTELEEGAIAFGYCSMCNHSQNPKAKIVRNYHQKTLDLVALEDIKAGEEVTIRYKYAYFEDEEAA